METLEKITASLEDFLKEVQSVRALPDLEKIRIKYLGKKGRLLTFNHLLKESPAEEKPAIGQELNHFKTTVADKIASLKRDLLAGGPADDASRQKKKYDLNRPGPSNHLGTSHPLQIVQDEITNCFNKMGFLTVAGPEIEEASYNFEALNIPENHPARDEQDSFYLKPGFLLRTQTSPVQIRTMQEVDVPLAIVSPGRVYRRDTSDASHSPIFHQIEGLYVNSGVNFSHLKGILHQFCREFFGDRPLRFRPDYFPFTEPSCEISMKCACGGKGCSTCGGDGWIEILGAGLVNPLVLKKVNIDPEKYSGLAFGLGVERIAMLKYGIKDIRLFYENNYKFLKQFSKAEGYNNRGNAEVYYNRGNTEVYYNRGNAKAGLKKYEAAIEDYNQAIELNPSYAMAYHNRGVAKADLEKYEAAIEDFTKAIELNPNFAIAYHNRGLAKADLGDYQAAIEDYNQVIKLNPSYAMAYNDRGLAKVDLEKYGAAIGDFNQAIELDPSYAMAYHNRGLTKANLEKYGAAIEDFTKAIELNPNFAIAYNNRGLAKADLGDYQAAIEDCNQAIELDPSYAMAYNNRGLAKADLEKYEAAIEDFNQAIELNPKDAMSYYCRGLAYELMGNEEQAERDFQQAKELGYTPPPEQRIDMGREVWGE